MNWFQKKFKPEKKLNYNIYRPPDICSKRFIDALNDSLLKLPARSEIVILGDFNIDYLAPKKDDPAFKSKCQLQKSAMANDLQQLMNIPSERVHEEKKMNC